MRTKKAKMIINWLMLLSLVAVVATGLLLKPYPGMWMGISHGVSGFLLVISAIIHSLQHGMLKQSKK